MADESKNRNLDDNIGKGDDLTSRIEHGSDFGKKEPNYQGNRNDKGYGTGDTLDRESMNRDNNVNDMNPDMGKGKSYGNEKKGDYKK